MNTEKYLTYRGGVKAMAFVGGTLAFVTVHPEGQPTAIYRLDPEKLTLTEVPLPGGGQALLAAGEDLWVAGTDLHVYCLPAMGKKPVSRGGAFDVGPVALALLSDDRLAVAAGDRVHVLARGDGKVLQALELPEAVTCLAADPTGQWLAAGTAKGTVAVFECETAPAEFQLSDSAPLHEAAVTALLFEADELRFLSAGADQKLLSTHARGRLEAEDRGRGATHEKPITAMIAVPPLALAAPSATGQDTVKSDRFLTGSTDSTIKSWPRAKGARPVTLKDGVGKVAALAVVLVHGKQQVAAACEDNSLRFFHLDEEGKFGEAVARVHGADAWAKHELSQRDPKRREAALRALAGFADTSCFKRIAAQMNQDSDYSLRQLACELLGQTADPRAAKELEKGLQHKEKAVRVLAFEGLRRHAGPHDLRALGLALKVNKADIGVRAVQELEGLAAKDDQAMARLTGALQSEVSEVRQATLASLEKIHGPDSPEASLTALGTQHADLRRLALVRLFERKLLHDPRVQLALRWRGDDQDPEVRRVAFLLSLYTREKLLPALRERDAELHRQLTELESGTLPKMREQPAAVQAQPAQKPAAASAADPGDLSSQLEAFAQQGLLPREFIGRLKQVAEQSPGSVRAMVEHIAAQIRATGLRPAEPEDDEAEDEEEDS